MPSTRTLKSISARSADLSLAVPQVVSHRLTRMALAGSTPSARDRKEFQRMVAEKNAAFAESWHAMALQAARANQALAMSMAHSFWSATLWGKRPSAHAVATQMQNAALGVLGKGLAPVHRKAVANAKRLAKTKLSK